jgi:hypothetical protein
LWCRRIETRAAEAAAGPRAAETTAARARAAEPATAAAEPAGARAAEAASRARAAGAAIFAGSRFAHRQRPAVEQHAVELLNGLFGVPAILELDEREAARTARFTIDRQHDLRRRGDGAEVRAKISFSGGVRQIAHEQTDSQSEISLLRQ